jgi:hypothetical protein
MVTTYGINMVSQYKKEEICEKYSMDIVRRKLIHKNTGPMLCVCGTTPMNRAPIRNNKKCPQIHIEISRKKYSYGKGFVRRNIVVSCTWDQCRIPVAGQVG